jgi:hypothetical protein
MNITNLTLKQLEEEIKKQHPLNFDKSDTKIYAIRTILYAIVAVYLRFFKDDDICVLFKSLQENNKDKFAFIKTLLEHAKYATCCICYDAAESAKIYANDTAEQHIAEFEAYFTVIKSTLAEFAAEFTAIKSTLAEYTTESTAKYAVNSAEFTAIKATLAEYTAESTAKYAVNYAAAKYASKYTAKYAVYSAAAKYAKYVACSETYHVASENAKLATYFACSDVDYEAVCSNTEYEKYALLCMIYAYISISNNKVV